MFSTLPSSLPTSATVTWSITIIAARYVSMLWSICYVYFNSQLINVLRGNHWTGNTLYHNLIIWRTNFLMS
jgi:hypothetical protein